MSDKISTISIASIYAFRMMGLFIILPIFSLYINKFSDATPTLLGIALGVYGLTQALLQIIFGTISDYCGRKPVIILGLILFILGSIYCALSTTIHAIIVGRALQGSGAIGSTLMALLTDLTKEGNTIKAMSVLGMTIGITFLISIILSPILNSILGLSGIFWLTAILGILAILILIMFVPSERKEIKDTAGDIPKNNIVKIFLTPQLIRLDIGILILHALLTSFFIVRPILLHDHLAMKAFDHWKIYFLILVVSCCLTTILILFAEMKNTIREIFLSAILTLILVQFLLYILNTNIIEISILLILFFTSFTLLESLLPSLISKTCPARSKGTAMGIFSSYQFLGIFIGGLFGGMVFDHFGLDGVLIFNGSLIVFWLNIAVKIKTSKLESDHLKYMK